jgi:formate hydrogenlyase subunit 6/NADH:ubiquinone oxidoreductase subunit I
MSYTITEKCNGCGACMRLCPADAISGEKKKLHTIDSGLCIECGACGRVCPQSDILDAEGVACIMIKRSEWPKPEITLKTCVACGICIDACPVGCLAMSEQPREKGVDPFPYLKDAKACISCGFCCRDCPVDAIVMSKPVKAQKAISEILQAGSGESA